MELSGEKLPSTLIGFLPLFIAFFTSFSILLINAKAGNLLISIWAAFLTWISYSAIHRLIVGAPLDDRNKEKELPSSETKWVLFGIAAFLFISGTALTALGLNAEENLQTFLGVGTVLSGYFIAHYEVGDHVV